MRNTAARCALVFTLALAPSAAAPLQRAPPRIVPLPQSLQLGAGPYAWPQRVASAAASPQERNVAAFAQSFLQPRGLAVAIAASGANAQLRLSRFAHDAALGPEGYRLTVDANGVAIAATSGAGLYYGLQSLEQLAPPAGAPSLPYVAITDVPRYRWRGIHLDVARHFFPVAVVERYIDLASHYKLNVFHWHLTDDQGWRIAIRRYPLLTTIGGCRAQTEANGDATEFDGTRSCGFYTQAQIRDVVAYAARRYVTIVPEIEMPGHAEAALAAYPQLACSPGPYRVRETWGVSEHILCPTDSTFAFLENVLSEVMQLFPGGYVHIGGDEVPKIAWQHSAAVHALMQREHITTYAQVQGYFDRRIARYLLAHGRRMIGWDEILDGGVSHGATVMSWRGVDGGIKAARRGNDVVMSPDGPLYFDALQGDENDEPQAIGGLTTTQMVYDYEPTPAGLTAQQAAHVIGVQGNLWTEYIATPDYLFYMLLPRELALSEIAWTQPQLRNWDAFQARLPQQLAWLERHGYNFRIPNPQFQLSGMATLHFANVSPSVRTVQAETDASDALLSIAAPVDAAIYYTTDGSTPTAHSQPYTAPLVLSLDPEERLDITAVAVLPSGRTSTPSELVLRRTP